MEEKDFQVIRSLIKLTATSEDAKVLAIACNDLAMFATAHPHGRYIINDLEGKGPVMALMQHRDSDVQKHALLCVQRLMLGRDKLDFLKRPAPQATAGGEAARMA
jgi:V-type H+-transporting ATPase subunit H